METPLISLSYYYGPLVTDDSNTFPSPPRPDHCFVLAEVSLDNVPYATRIAILPYKEKDINGMQYTRGDERSSGGALS